MLRSLTMRGSNARRAFWVLALGALLVGWFLSGDLDRWQQGDDRGVPNLGIEGEVMVSSSEGFGFGTLAEMVATAHTVVLGTVDDERRGAVEDDAEVRITQRLLYVRVERTLAGRRPGSGVVISTKGWQQIDGQPETRLRMEDYPRIDVGNRVVLFLFDANGDGRYGFINSQGIYLVRGDMRLEVGHTHDPLTLQIARLPLTELERQVQAAAAAARRGEVRPQLMPGTVTP
jgi:hypothetical protein